ncbi:MAG: hypothetical protein WDN00_00410 [Limisphaerales bacterium]
MKSSYENHNHTEFSAMPGKTLLMVAGNPAAILVTRKGNKMRERSMRFADSHIALDWCLARQTTFVLLSQAGITTRIKKYESNNIKKRG